MVFWGKTKKKREPISGKRRNENLPPTEWRMRDAPEQRIVSDEMWDRVQRRLAEVKTVYGDAGRKAGLLRAVTMNSPYLFSGLLKCGRCGANLTVVSGRGRNHQYAHYGCPMNAFRGESVCASKLRIRHDQLERRLLQGLQGEVLREDVIEYTLERFGHELVKALDSLSGEIETLRARKAELDLEVRRMVRALAEGYQSRAVMAEIGRCESESESTTARLLEARPGSVQDRLKGMRRFVISKTSELRELLNSDVTTARVELLKHVKAIVIHQEAQGWRATGDWDLLGSGEIVRMECAGGQS